MGGNTDEAIAGLDFRMAIDNDFAEIRQNLRGPIAAHGQLQQFRCLLQESSCHTTGEELGMQDEIKQKGDICFDASNAELLQAALHPTGCILEP